MSDHEPEIRQAVEDWMAGAGADGAHPDAETLAAYHARELPEEDERRVQDHLLVCRECAELLLDLDGLSDPEFGREVEIPEGTGEVLWERLRERGLGGEGPGEAGSEVLPFRRRPPRWLPALAAALLAAVIGLSGWVASLRQTVRDLSRPEVNAPVLDLAPLGSGPRAGESAPVAEVPSGARMFTLILSPARRGDFQDYEAEIARADGEVARRTGLRPNVYGSFSLIETRQSLGDGEHRVRLYGLSPGRRELLGEYVVRIAP